MTTKKKEVQEPKQDFISNLPKRKQHILALAILFILPLILFSATIFGDKQFIGHDIIQWRAGAESIIEYRDSTGTEPLWAQNMFSGMPAYVVSYHDAVPSLDDLLFATTKSIYPATRYWVLLAGVYLFLVIMGIRPLVATLGAILVGFTTYIPIIIEAGHNTKFTTYVFIPWLLLGYSLIRNGYNRWLCFFVLSVSGLLVIRGSHPQVTYYFLILLLFWWLYDTIIAYKNNNLVNWSKVTGLLALAAVLGLMANLQPYWSMFEYTPYSIRGGSELQQGSEGLDLQYAFRWSQGWGELGTLIIPDLYGGASSSGAYWGPKPVTSGPHYFGAIGFLLALIGIFRYRYRIRYLFLGVGILTLLFSLGSNFMLFNRLMFNYLPLFDKFRTPEMWLIITVFCFSVLAVFGVEALFDLFEKKRERLKSLYLPAGIAIGLGALILLGTTSWMDYQKPGEIQQYANRVAQQNNVSPDNPQVQQRVRQYLQNNIIPERQSKAQSDAGRYLLFVILGTMVIALFITRKLSAGYALTALLLLTVIDMLPVDSRYITENSMSNQSVDREQMVQQKERDTDRYISENIKTSGIWPHRVFPLNRNPFNNAVPAYFYPSVGGYTGAKLSYYQELIENFLSPQQGPDQRVLDMLNVKYITSNYTPRLPNVQSVYNGQQGAVYRNNSVLPKAFFVDSVITSQTASSTLDKMNSSQFAPAENAIVRTEQSITSTNDTTSSVEVESYGPRRIDLNVSRSEPGFMVLSEVYYPEGWRAYVDGEKTPIYKTNYVLRGIEVPDGDHEISFRFNPISHVWGVRISYLGHLLVWLTAIIALIRYYRPSSKE